MNNISKENLQAIRDAVKKMQASQNSKNAKNGAKSNFAGMAYTR